MINCYAKEDLNTDHLFLPANAQEGFGSGYSITVSGQEENLLHFLLALYQNSSDSFADFYFASLEKADQERFLSGLSDCQKQCFDQLLLDTGKVFYPLNQSTLSFFFSITVSEWLFSTFYFGDPAITVWGNYNHTFPVFSRNKKALDEAANLAAGCGLTVR